MNFVDNFEPYEQITNFIELVSNLELGLETYWLPDYFNISAWYENIPIAFWLTKILKPETLVELGTHYGVSYMSFCQAIKRLSLSTKCFAVDTWQGDFQSGHYTSKVFKIVNDYNKTNYSDFSKLIRKTFDGARLNFQNKSIDLLHIDGMHTYDAVRHDYETWLSTLSNRGIIIFHDINIINDKENFGVWKFWKEIKNSFPSFTFPLGPGLGILGVGKNLSTPLQFLFSSTGNDVRNIQSIFGTQGLLIKHIADLFSKQMKKQNLFSFSRIIDGTFRRFKRLTHRFFS
ncbi:MAG: class I SAM-dependent methyltransferase [Clostridiales Family XIII bacterium]|nr:class I SAM-dependent methyltransferase [Clostridiales Family XIII bacterium]